MFIKLFSTYIFILFLTFSLVGLAFHLIFQNEVLKRYDSTYEYQQEQIFQFFDLIAKEEYDQDTFTTTLEFILNQQDRVVILLNSTGDVVYNSEVINDFDLDLDFDLNRFVSEEGVSERIIGEDRVVYVISSKINLPHPYDADLSMVMVFHEFDEQIKKLRGWVNITMLTAVAIAAIIIYLTSKKLISPLKEMNKSALEFAKGNFTHRIKIETKDEIGQLGETMNYMAKELGGIDQMRKDFVANVSHDLRSPLTSIKGFLGALIDGTIPIGQQSKYFNIMKKETERLMKLVEDLLDMARLEANQLELYPKVYNVSEQVRVVIAKMEPELSKHQVEIQLINDKDVYVIADQDRIHQVLVNLLQNALQFSQRSSKIDVAIKTTTEEACISICDYGFGMKQEDLQFIWERFYKKEKARTYKGGTGIGLSIVKHIIDSHQATIDVDSKLGEGTTFTFTLKLAE